MALTPRQLNRSTLARQLLLDREAIDVVDAVHRVVALQAQEAASPYVALANRIADFDPGRLDAAFNDHSIIKAPLMRITLHAVDAADYPDFHEAMQPTLRASRLNDRRFRSTGLSIDDADALVPHLTRFATEPRSKEEIEAMLGDRLGAEPDRGVWWALRTYAPVVHAPTGGAWTFGATPAYLTAPVAAADPQGSVERLLLRYLQGFGPASVADFGQYTMLRRPIIDPALASLGDTLSVVEGPDGSTLLDAPGATVPDEDAPAPPRLLGMWDSIMLAYADRGRVIPEAYRTLVLRRNGDVLPTLLVDGYVAGVWRPVEEAIEARAFHRLPVEAWDALEVEAGRLAALFAGRQPTAYGRAGWWSDLPDGESRVIGG